MLKRATVLSAVLVLVLASGCVSGTNGQPTGEPPPRVAETPGHSGTSAEPAPATGAGDGEYGGHPAGAAGDHASGAEASGRNAGADHENGDDASGKIPLFRHAGVYDGTREKAIIVEGEARQAAFVRLDFLPYGLYMPDTLEEIRLEDGNEFKHKERQARISIFDEELGRFIIDTTELTFLDDLDMYREYAGTYVYDEYDVLVPSYEDYFWFDFEGNRAFVRLSSFETDRDVVLPHFLDIVSYMQYIGE